MKTKLMALLLAVCLGVTGVAATVQAAEIGTEEDNECAHTNKLYERTDVVEAINWGGGRHYVVYRISYFCPDCDKDVENCYATYESHDYEQIYYDDGRVKSYCTICDEYYYW